MNRGLIVKAARELWPATLFCGALLAAFEALLAYVLPTLQGQFAETMLQLRFMQTFLSAMLGTEVSNQLGPETFFSLSWVHPVVLATVWAHALVCCTRVPAGEIDRGTADVLLGLPVTRWEIVRSETVVWLAAGLAMLVAGFVGNELGGWNVPGGERPRLGRMIVVVANLFCVYVAVGGLAWLVSAASDRRGPAITVVFVILLSSFLLNFLAQFWEPAERVQFLGLLNYYRPLYVFRDGTVPWRDMGVLLAAGGVLWTAAGWVFARRDVCTV
ncbi:MAG: ABC transporter permease subunit [Planctomycetia bacterium]|nr:ABC transporter permease subunit [Planctomycetia bacterium]